jgi:glycosyltransferase involved in cell wall biosynthesis
LTVATTFDQAAVPIATDDRGLAAIAVCICTSDRPEPLEPALRSVLNQSRRAYEVLVIDQSDGDATARLVTALQANEPRLRYIHVTRKGLSRAYNTALASTSAELLAFTDDDCVAAPSWLEAIARCFAEEPDTGIVYGQVLMPPELEARENVDGNTPVLPIERRRRMSRRDGYKVFGMGANFAARRSVLQGLGGFDEVLGGGGPLQSAQDFDLSYRAFRRDQVILLAPEVVVHHFGFRSTADWPRVMRSYGIGVGGFYGKHLRLRDMYATRLFAGFLVRQTARAAKRTIGRRGNLDWAMLYHTLVGFQHSFRYSINRKDMLYRSPSA